MKNNSSKIWSWRVTAGFGIVLALALLLAVSIGPVSLNPIGVFKTLLGFHDGLSPTDQIILLQIRLPRVLLAGLVGAALSTSGAVYQTVFRNPLADPYLLGVASGAGLGATIAILGGQQLTHVALPVFAFAGGVLAVAATFLVSGSFYADPRTLLLAGIAVGSFATAAQTYLFQSHSAVLRTVYSWILGQLTVADWPTVGWTAFYLAVSLGVLFGIAKRLDGLLLSDEEAHSLGLRPNRLRIVALVAATLATATAVAASGLIGFVGLVIPHLIRGLLGRATNRALPAVALAGAAFLMVADLGARTLLAPAELPIGVITAFVGAPFFLFLLRSRSVQ
jgi:iron complex transport system permease protein